jgi:F420H(2)-dependent quinone reductase
MSRGVFNSPVIRIVNDAAVFLINAPVVGRLIGRGLVVIRYVGRRTGTTFEIPVGYRRAGDSFLIGVSAPDAKKWWRNFLGDGAPITFVNFNGQDRNGHAVANRDARGRVSVTVRLDDRR